MKAVCWYGKHDVRVEKVPDPQVVNPRDAIVRITSTAICGSDLHLYDGVIPTMQRGDVLGHEFMGEVVDVGSAVSNLAIGDRVIVPFTISCGCCYYCSRHLWSLCDNSNPNYAAAASVYGDSPAGLFGYSHMFGGYPGGQAEYARVPLADTGAYKLTDDLPDEQVLFLTDIFPTGFQAAEQGDIKQGDTVAVWGAGPVGQFAIRSALMFGAERVIAIDHYEERLKLAARADGVETINFDEADVYDQLMETTGGRGPDVCIDAVGMEAHGQTLDAMYDRVKTATYTATDRGHVLRQAIRACRKGGTVSVPGVYGGFMDMFPIGLVFNKALTLRGGQTHVHKYMHPLFERIRDGQIDPSFIISHTMSLDDAPTAYKMFKNKTDGCTKVVLKPH